MYKKRLYRSESNYVIAGVCGCIAEYTGINPTLVRVIFFFIIASLPVYLILAFILPKGRNL